MIKTIFYFCLLLSTGIVQALPDATTVFCQQYPDSGLCKNDKTDCTTCHAGPPNLNDYGKCVKTNLNGDFNSSIENAILSSEDEDCDNDGVSNHDEIVAGFLPGDKNNTPSNSNNDGNNEPRGTCDERNQESDWNICGYD